MKTSIDLSGLSIQRNHEPNTQHCQTTAVLLALCVLLFSLDCIRMKSALQQEKDVRSNFCFFVLQTSPCLSSHTCNTCSEPNSLTSSPCGSPLTHHRQHHLNGHIKHHHLHDGYSSLERLNRRPRVNKCSLEKLFLRRASLDAMGNVDRLSSGGSGTSSRGSSSEEDELMDDMEFNRNRRERSTVLVRRFFKNNQKVFILNDLFILLELWWDFFVIIYSLSLICWYLFINLFDFFQNFNQWIIMR